MFESLSLVESDPEIYAAIKSEDLRQEEHVELIASENYASPLVMKVQGSKLTNKYAEGYPSKRFYGGCENVDEVERLAIERAKSLFGAEYANVQPHSGSQANQAVFHSILKPGDTIMGMDLGHGGHLTHGSPANLSGKLFKVVSYGLNEKGEIDYDEIEENALKNRVKLLIGGASSYALRFDFERMSRIAKKAEAYFMVDMAHYAGLIAAGLYPNPVPHADFVTSTTHKTLRGPRGGFILAKDEHSKIIDSNVFPTLQGGPLMHVIAAKAVAFKEASTLEFKEYQGRVIENAKNLLEELNARGLKSVSGRTESHMFLINLQSFNPNLTGKQAEYILGKANITVNKNAVPNDERSPFVTSGIRLGTPAITTRGFGKNEIKMLAKWMVQLLSDPNNLELASEIRIKVKRLCANFPVYNDL